MNKLATTFFILLFLTSCDTASLVSGASSKYNNDSARGLTGGGIGGGIIIVENSKDFSSTKKYIYNIYLEENGNKTKLDSNTYSNSGSIELAQNVLDSDQVKKIQDGNAKIIVEIVDTETNIKTAVEGKIKTKNSSGDNKDTSLA
jgi:hypothetical protein